VADSEEKVEEERRIPVLQLVQVFEFKKEGKDEEKIGGTVPEDDDSDDDEQIPALVDSASTASSGVDSSNSDEEKQPGFDSEPGRPTGIRTVGLQTHWEIQGHSVEDTVLETWNQKKENKARKRRVSISRRKARPDYIAFARARPAAVRGKDEPITPKTERNESRRKWWTQFQSWREGVRKWYATFLSLGQLVPRAVSSVRLRPSGAATPAQDLANESCEIGEQLDSLERPRGKEGTISTAASSGDPMPGSNEKGWSSVVGPPCGTWSQARLQKEEDHGQQGASEESADGEELEAGGFGPWNEMAVREALLG
jgi:hypothetical protein